MTDQLQESSVHDARFSSEEKNSTPPFSDARYSSAKGVFQSIQPGNVRRLVEKFRCLGEQTYHSKPNVRLSCTRKVPGSLSKGHALRSVSIRKKELLAARKKSDRFRKSPGLDEKWVLLTPCLFSPGDFVSSSVSISPAAAVDHRRFSQSFASDSDLDSRDCATGPVSSLASCDRAVEELRNQIECTDVVTFNHSTDHDRITEDAKLEDFLDVTSKFLKDDASSTNQKSDAFSIDDWDKKGDTNFVVNENNDDKPQLPVNFCPSESEVAVLASSTSSNELASKTADKDDDEDCDDDYIYPSVEILSKTRRNSSDRSELEFEKKKNVVENLYENVSNNSFYEEIEINPKLQVCRDQTSSSSLAESLTRDGRRSRCDSAFSICNNSVDSFDSDLTDFEIIHRKECLSLSLPAQANNKTSKPKQENLYQNVGPAVKSHLLDTSTHVTTSVNTSEGIYLLPTEIARLQNEARKSEKHHKKTNKNEEPEYEEYDFNSNRPMTEQLLGQANGHSCIDDEHIYEEFDFILRSSKSIVNDATCRTDRLDKSPSTGVTCVCLASKVNNSTEDDSDKSRTVDEVISGDSDASSVFDSVSSCSEFRERESSEAESEQNVIFEPVNKLERIKAELVETERKYIERLRLINSEFRMALISWNEENKLLPPNAFRQMFLNIDVIYQLHSSFFLPDLEDCIKSEKNKHFEDVFLKTADFLKLYAEYSCNFDSALKTIEMWKMRVPEFNKMIQEIQRKPICHSLTLEHHMLEPIQRIPRYKLLLSSYLENLPKDSAEYEKVEKALIKVTAAASHCDSYFESLEKFRKVLDVQQSLWNKIELLTPSRELILSGRMKVTQQLENDEEKHLFLFSDMLLVCKKFPPGITPPYKLTLQLDVGDMQVMDRKKFGTAESFFVVSKQAYLEIHPSSLDEREKWISALQTAISNVVAQESSRRCGKSSGNAGIMRQKSVPGHKAPIWIKDLYANRCMQCDEGFNAVRRRHHCRACGIVVCGKCSNKQMPLEFDGYTQNHRVCDKCYHEIKNSVDQNRFLSGEGKSFGVHGQHRTSFFFFDTPGEKSQNREQTNDEQKFSLLTSSLEAIIESN